MDRRRFLLSTSNRGGEGSEIEFYLSFSSEILKYTAMSNMTWIEFIASDYNIDNKITEYHGGTVVFKGSLSPCPIIDGSIAVNIDDYIKPNNQYIVIMPGAD